MSRRLQVTLYVLFTVFALVGSFVVTFPYGALGRRLQVEAAKALPGSTVAIGEVGPALPLGVRLSDVVFARDLPSGKTLKLSIDRIRLRPALFSLVTGKPGVSYSVDAFQGSVTGDAKMTKTGAKVDAVLSGLQLDAGKTIEKATGVPVSGGLSGRIELTTDKQGMVTDGSIAAVVAGAKVRNIQIMGGKIQLLDLGSPEVNAVITKGQVKIAKAEVESPDLKLNITGDVSLRPNLMMSFIKGQLKARPSDAFLKREKLDGLLSLAPAQFKRPDGSIELTLNGPLARPVSIPFMMPGRF